ncbi:MAG: hypothetical protein ACI32B_01980 [Erysipelotrichaceae bacterium]
MKHNKYIHDEDYDINIKLMAPLLCILVCTICLCATTWAWYTASVSTGVTSIVTGANVSENVSYDEGCTVTGENGSYTLSNNTESNIEFRIQFILGEAANGYFAEISISDNPSITNLLYLFANRIYAEEGQQEVITNGNYYFYIDNNNNTLKISLAPGVSKKISINYIWASDAKDENNKPKYTGDVKDSSRIDNSGAGILLESNTNIPKYKYSIRFVNNVTYEEIREKISDETVYESVILSDYEIDGYEIVAADCDKTDEEGMRFYINPDIETNEFVIYYQKKAVEDNTSQGTETVGDAEESIESDSETDTNQSNSIPDAGNNSEYATVTSPDNTVESLLVTDTTSSEETSSVTQSIDSSSSTYTSSETENNVSE